MSSNPDAAMRDAMIQAATRIYGDKQQLANWNLSETLAIKRILQIPHLGLSTNDVSSKLYKPDWKTTDLNSEDKKIRREIFEMFMKRCKEDPELDKMNWTLVLYQYELYKGHGRRFLDWGHLVFCDNTATKWILVSCWGDRGCECCGNPYEKDYEEILRCQTQRFLNALSYLPSMAKVQWVRGTYTTLQYPELHPSLLDFSITTSSPAQNGLPALVHLTPDSLTPCLTQVDLTRIDGFLKVFKFTPPNDEIKQKVLLPDGKSNPCTIIIRHVHPDMNAETSRECQGCGECFGWDQIKYCTGCYGVFFCSEKCQKGNWKVHKLVCRSRR
ncbi:hypothetical protein JCM5353_001550 [Sporobolomyces roseus]